MTLHLVCDNSGSMSKGGKPFTARTAVMATAQWARFGYASAEIRLCGWASEARYFLDWSIEDEFPPELLSCGGNSNGAALIQLLGDKPDGKVLLITDGFWPGKDAKILKHWKECLPPDTLRVIKIGADSNPQVKGPNVYASEDLFAALDGWLEGVPT